VKSESIDEGERVAVRESATQQERVGADDQPAVAGAAASASADLPRYRLGYPRIEASTHRLWPAQQDGWPDHLPHEAWQALASAQTKADQPKASSADHPAFAAGYVPNYAATQEKPSDEYLAKRRGDRPRR